MNHSIHSADRTTHLKIVIAALVASILVAGVGIGMRLKADNGYSQTDQIIKIKARQPDQKFGVSYLHPK
jgi:hypothetical protein